MAAEGFLSVQRLVASTASKFSKNEPLLLAVSKTRPAEMLSEVYALGHRHFGENYAQEFVDKAKQLPTDIKWHFIGHLQSNKVKMILHSLKLAAKIESTAKELNRNVNVYVEFKTSSEESKTGAVPEDAFSIIDYIQKSCQHVKFCGLMTIADPERPLECFEKLARERTSVAAKFGLDENALVLSMGMSGDLEEALQAGATEVRIGAAIFGAR